MPNKLKSTKQVITPKTIEFEDHPEFRPNLTPKQVLQSGSFGGTYYRNIHSSVTGKDYTDAWKEFPDDWFEGLNINKQVARKWDDYDTKVNKYGVKVGTTLEFWEGKMWIRAQDPYGWFQWYCRFYEGRRSPDDSRQIGRYNAMRRFKGPLMKDIRDAGAKYNDYSISPGRRQTLLHWGYELTEKDYKDWLKKNKK